MIDSVVSIETLFNVDQKRVQTNVKFYFKIYLFLAIYNRCRGKDKIDKDITKKAKCDNCYLIKIIRITTYLINKKN